MEFPPEVIYHIEHYIPPYYTVKEFEIKCDDRYFYIKFKLYKFCNNQWGKKVFYMNISKYYLLYKPRKGKTYFFNTKTDLYLTKKKHTLIIHNSILKVVIRDIRALIRIFRNIDFDCNEEFSEFDDIESYKDNIFTHNIIKWHGKCIKTQFYLFPQTAEQIIQKLVQLKNILNDRLS